jgi:hypothetical protein
MNEIPEIGIRPIDIPRSVFINPSQSIPLAPPVTVELGFPIVELPGCVEAYQSNNKNLPQDDERGILTLCDSGVPSFNPIQFEPLQVIPTKPAQVESRQSKPEEPEIEIPSTNPPKIPTPEIICPTPSQNANEPVGSYVNGFRKKVIEYRLIGRECIQITDDVSLTEQIIAGVPSGGQVTMTSTIAVVATSSAIMAKPLADLLLKVVKPTIKKVIVKISKIRGKQSEILSVKERRDQQRIQSHALRQMRGKE